MAVGAVWMSCLAVAGIALVQSALAIANNVGPEAVVVFVAAVAGAGCGLCEYFDKKRIEEDD